MENCRLAFYITTVLTSISVEVFWKIVCVGKRKTKLRRHHFISMVCMQDIYICAGYICRINVYQLVAVKNHFVACV